MLTKTSFSSSLLSHTYSEATRTHTFIFYEATRIAYDDFLKVMTKIYQDVTLHDDMRMLIDYRQSSIPPLHYMIPKSLAWVRTLTVHPKAKIAVVTRQDSVSRVLRSMTSTIRFGHLSTGIFEGDKGYDQALVWLQK